ncbi:MAG: LysM peptidoglycan-binding domain-containing protein [Chloroflexota bacterium]
MFYQVKVALALVLMVIGVQSAVLAQDTAAFCEVDVDRLVGTVSSSCRELVQNQICYRNGSVDVEPDVDGFSSGGDVIETDSVQRVTVGSAAGEGDGSVFFRAGSPPDQMVYLLATGSLTVEDRATGPEVPFQSLFLSSPGAFANCETVRSLLVFYVSEGEPHSLTLNDATIRVSGTVFVRQVNANKLTFAVPDGTLEIDNGTVVTSGEAIETVTNNRGSIRRWGTPRPIDATELAQTQVAGVVFEAWMGIAFNSPPPVRSTDGCPDAVLHTVAVGESLGYLALLYDVAQDRIVEANNIADPNLIDVGQQLTIPCGNTTTVATAPTSPPPQAIADEPPAQAAPRGTCGPSTVHVVSPNETVYLIALGYGTTVEAISAANGLADPTTIHAGNSLSIPCNTGTTAPQTAPSGTAQVAEPPPTPDAQDFCSSFFALAPQAGYPPEVIALFNAQCR